MTALASRVAIAKTPPPPEGIFRLAWFPGETGDSGRDMGLDGRSAGGISSGCHEGFAGKSRIGVPDSRSGLIMGVRW